MLKRKDHVAAFLSSRFNPWEIERTLSLTDAAYLHLLAAIYEAAIDDAWGRTKYLNRDDYLQARASAITFLRRDPYGYLTDDIRAEILRRAEEHDTEVYI